MKSIKSLKSLNKDSLLIVFCITVILVSSYLLYKELTDKIYRSDEDAIGMLIIKKNVAERKYTEYVIWESLSNTTPFFSHDSIRTDADSAAYLQFHDGKEIHLDEETMILVVPDKRGVKIDLDKGSISVKNHSSGTITVNTKDLSLSIDQGEFSAKKTGDSVNLNVASGEAIINKKGEITKISSNVSANISNEKIEIKELAIISESPLNNNFFVISKNRGTINFKWSSNLSNAETIQVSSDPNFKNIKYTGTTRLKTYSFDIIPGNYHWRVVSGTEISQARKFTVLSDKQPEILFPKMNETVKITEGETVNFKWSKSDIALDYDFYLSQDQNPQNNTICVINSANITNLKSGEVVWNVRYRYPDGFVILFDPKVTGVFNIEKVSSIHAKPNLLNDSEMKVSRLSDNMVFNWEKCKGVKDYTIYISKDNEFKEIVQTFTTKSTAYSSKIPPEGRYFFRVSANYNDNVAIISDIITFDVIAPQPVVYLAPENGLSITHLFGTLRFIWEDIAKTRNYLFELSSDPNFENTIHSVKTEKTNFQIKVPDKGMYYWKVTILNKYGVPAVSAETAYFAVEDFVKKMLLVSPENMDVFNLDNIDSINCAWVSVEGADSYEIEFFQSIDGKDKSVLVLDSKETDISLSNFSIFKSEEVKWLVRAKKVHDRRLVTIDESEMSSFIIKVNENISAPKVKSPKVIYVK